MQRSKLCDSKIHNLSPKVQKCIQNIVQNEGFESYNVEVKEMTTGGGNYLAILQEIEINGKKKTGDTQINLFVKNSIPAKEVTALQLDVAYSREAYVYNELFKIFDELQNQAGVPLEERLKTVKGYEESNSEITILESLSKKGYVTGDRLKVMTIEFAELSLKQLARFHALSFVLQKFKPDYFKKHIKPLNAVITFNEDWAAFSRKVIDTAIDNLHGDLKDKIEKYYTVMMDKYINYWNPAEKDAKCLCHGDFKSNNILMKQENGKLVDVVVIDYQIIYYGQPFLDIAYLIGSTTDRKFRQEHLENLKELYYDNLKTFLEYFDMQIEDVYPRKEFDNNCRDQLDYSLMVFLILAPFMFSTGDEIPDISKSIAEVKYNLGDEYKRRLQEIVEEFVEMGYL